MSYHYRSLPDCERELNYKLHNILSEFLKDHQVHDKTYHEPLHIKDLKEAVDDLLSLHDKTEARLKDLFHEYEPVDQEMIELAKEMATQDNLATQFPYWVVLEDNQYDQTREDDEELDKVVSCFAGIFMTHKRCLDHIEQANHHYVNPRPYCLSFHANKQMQAVQQYIFTSTNTEIPSWYK